MEPRVKEVLVIGGDPSVEWTRYFAGRTTASGTCVRVTQCAWDAITLTCHAAESAGGRAAALVTLPSRCGRSDTFQPDVVLVRSALRAAAPTDHRNVLLGLAFAGVPCVNSAASLWLCQEKPLVYAALCGVRDRLGNGPDAFPLIAQTYYPGWRAMTLPPALPAVAKVGTVHAGLGKMRLDTAQQYFDLRSVVALTGHYVTTEPCIDWDYDFRLQKIGPHVRGFRRTSDNWKGQGWASRDVDAPVTPRQRAWLDAVAAALGMDILTIDGVHDRATGRDYIVEVNDSAIGLNERHRDEDYGHIVDLVISKLSEIEVAEEARAATTVPKAVETNPADSDGSAPSDGTDGENQKDDDAAKETAAETATTETPTTRVARVDDPTALALETAQTEIARLRARVAELEADLARSREKKGISKLFFS